MNRIKETFRALKYRNFRLFFPGIFISQVGIWIQNVAIYWIAYDITKSPFIMGWVMFFNAIPLFLLTPFGGVIADKFDRQKLLIFLQILYSIQALILTTLAFLDLIQVWNIILMGVFLNTIVAIDMPLRQSLFAIVVDDKKDLGNAISLNSTCFNAARLIGPAVGGIILSSFGTDLCFLINFLFLIPLIVLVLKMNIKDKKDEKIQHETILEGLKEGLIYCVRTPQILTLLIYLGLYCFLIMIYPMLLPIYTVEILHDKAHVLGILVGSAGAGSLIASLLLAMKVNTSHLRWIIFSGAILASLCFIGMGFSSSSNLAMILMLGVGIGSTAVFTSENMLLQSFIDDDKRGRVMSMNSIAFLGTMSFSSLFAGSIAHVVGISNTFILLGVIMLSFAVILSYKLSKMKF